MKLDCPYKQLQIVFWRILQRVNYKTQWLYCALYPLDVIDYWSKKDEPQYKIWFK